MLMTGLPHRNQQFFSDHYLDVTLPGHPDWRALIEQARPVYALLKGIYSAQYGSGTHLMVQRTDMSNRRRVTSRQEHAQAE